MNKSNSLYIIIALVVGLIAAVFIMMNIKTPSVVKVDRADTDACEINARVSIVGNEFDAIQTVGSGAQKCKGAKCQQI